MAGLALIAHLSPVSLAASLSLQDQLALPSQVEAQPAPTLDLNPTYPPLVLMCLYWNSTILLPLPFHLL